MNSAYKKRKARQMDLGQRKLLVFRKVCIWPKSVVQMKSVDYCFMEQIMDAKNTREIERNIIQN